MHVARDVGLMAVEVAYACGVGQRGLALRVAFEV